MRANIENFLKHTTLVVACATGFAGISRAATVTPPGTSAVVNWATEGDWTNATVVSAGTGFKLPAASVPDTAVINANRTVEVTNVVDVIAGAIQVNNQTPSAGVTTGTLNILAGGLLSNAGGAITVAANTNAGLLSVQGGTLLSSSNIVVNQNGVMNVSSGNVTAARLSVGSGNTNIATLTANGTVNISGGVVTTTNGSSALGAPGVLVNGTLNLTGGALVLVDPIPGGTTYTPVSMTSNAMVINSAAVNLNGGSLISAGSTSASDAIQIAGKFNLNSGQFIMTNGQVIGRSDATYTTILNVNGSGTTIFVDRININSSARAATINFTFDANGISPFQQSQTAYVSLQFAALNINGSAWTNAHPGEHRSFDLFLYDQVLGLTTVTNITGFGSPGTDYTFEQILGNSNSTNDLLRKVRLNFRNNAPVVQTLTNNAVAGTTNTWLVVGGVNGPTDAQGDSMTISALSPTAVMASDGTTITTTNGNIVKITGESSITYEASNPAFTNGTDSFTYVINDGHGATTRAYYFVNVTNAPTAPSPATLTNSVSGNTLSLSWPPSQGWRLESQTNLLSSGLGTNWQPAAASSVSSTNITIDATQPTVFYRLVFP